MSDSTWNQQTHAIRTYASASVRSMAVPVLWQYVIAVALLSFFRLGWLTHQSLWFDEGYTLNLVSVSTFREFLKLFGSYTTSEHLQPLYYFLMFAWSRIAGSSDTALRLPSALFSIGSGVCLFDVLRQLTTRGTKAYAMLGIGLFAVSSYSVYYAHEARPYACVQFCSFLLLLTWIRQGEPQNPGGHRAQSGRAALACACVLACLSSAFGALLVLSLAFADLYRLRRETSIWKSSWVPGLVASATVVVMYGIFGALRFPSVLGKDIVAVKQPLWMNAAYSIFGTLFGTTIGPSTTELRSVDKMAALLHALPVLLCAALIVIAMGWAVTRIVSLPSASHHAKVIGLAASVYSVFLFGGFGGLGRLNVLPRHASGLFALCVVTLTACAFSGSTRSKRIPRMVLCLSLTAAFVMNAVSLLRSMYSPSCRKDDYRAVAEFVSQQRVPVFLTSGQTNLLKHYGGVIQSAVDVEPSQLGGYLSGASPRSPQILVVTNTFRNYRWDNKPSVEAMLQPTYVCREENTFAYFEVLSCALRVQGHEHTQLRGSHAL